MRILRLTSFLIRVPLRKEFRHASHRRRHSDNVLVRCELADGTEGWGEGVPRPYVTGETPEGAMAQLAATRWAEQIDRACNGWEDVISLCSGLQPEPLDEDPRQCRANSVRCAVELSVLDAYGRLFGEPVSQVTHHFPPATPLRTTVEQVQFSGAVSAASPLKESTSALKMRLFGFAHCKVKVGMPSVNDVPRLARIRRWLGPRMDVRIDANEAWHASEAVARLQPLLPSRISCVEQPVPHEEVECLAEIRRRVPVPVMLDESLTSRVDAERAVRANTCDLFNLRLSKCGGFLNCLRLAALAYQAGLGYQLGCHPGETGILSAAGRHFAASVRDIRYHEGSYDRFLLRDNVVNENITFGYGGRAPALAGPGLGVTVNRDALHRMSFREQEHRIE